MIRFPLIAAPLLLTACSSNEEPAAEQSAAVAGADDFASRIGTAAQAPGATPVSAAELAAKLPSRAVKGAPPPGANVFAVEKLGDIGGVNLGPRAGGCTFVSGGTEMLIAAGPSDPAIPGKGVVRIGGKLLELDTPPGGIEAIRAGTDFNGEGFSIRLTPTAQGKGTMTITNSQGQQKTVAGDWVCA